MSLLYSYCCFSPQTVNGTVVVKRGRGRPPGTRNKSTLIAQAKVLAQQQAKAKAAAAAAAAAESQHPSPVLTAKGSTHMVTPP